MKGHLIRFTSYAITLIMKVKVFFEIRALVSRVTVFNKIRKKLYLQKSSYSFLFESIINSLSLISFKFTSLNPNQSFEANSIQFGH